MNGQDKTKEELTIELRELQEEYNFLKASCEKNMTERKHAEALLNDVIDNNPISIQIVDSEGLTLLGNPAYTRLFGAIPPPDFSVFDNLQNKSKELEQLIALAKSGEVVYLPDMYFNPHEEVAEAPDNPLWIRALIFPILDKRGKPERFVFMHEDITKRKSIEKALLKNEKEIKRAQEIAHIGSFSIDLTTNEVKWTEELYKMYGFDPTLPPPLLDESQKLFAPESWALLSSSISNTYITGEPYEIELKTVKDDGSTGWMWAKGEAVVNANGKITDIWGAVHDITLRKQAEEELKQKGRELTRQNELFNSLITNLPIGVFMVEAPSGKPLVANEAALKLLGSGILLDASKHNLEEVYQAFINDTKTPYPVDKMPIVQGMEG